jgi:hypothetical protein
LRKKEEGKKKKEREEEVKKEKEKEIPDHMIKMEGQDFLVRK